MKEYEGQCSFIDPSARLIYNEWYLDLFPYTEYYDTIEFLPDGTPSFNRSDILPLARCNLMEVEMLCPRDPKKILGQHYSSLHPSRMCFNKTWILRKEYDKLSKLDLKKP